LVDSVESFIDLTVRRVILWKFEVLILRRKLRMCISPKWLCCFCSNFRLYSGTGSCAAADWIWEILL